LLHAASLKRIFREIEFYAASVGKRNRKFFAYQSGEGKMVACNLKREENGQA